MSFVVENQGFFSKLLARFRNCFKGLRGALSGLTKGLSEDASNQEIEDQLIEADVDPDLAAKIVASIKSKIHSGLMARDALFSELVELFAYQDATSSFNFSNCVTLFIGTNGSGKTTTIAKIAALTKKQDSQLLLVACDTFRAAAETQLTEWATKIGCEIFSTDGAPPTVVFQSLEYARSRGLSTILIDTAGRLHNNKNLLEELKKTCSSVEKFSSKFSQTLTKQVVLVLDGTNGQALREQVREFKTCVGHIDGLIVTKLDGVARGGIVFSLANEFKIPFLYLGVGECAEDLRPFNAKNFISMLLED